jgi:hypothetical protein
MYYDVHDDDDDDDDDDQYYRFGLSTCKYVRVSLIDDCD